jgi:hypothetical protein
MKPLYTKLLELSSDALWIIKYDGKEIDLKLHINCLGYVVEEIKKLLIESNETQEVANG